MNEAKNRQVQIKQRQGLVDAVRWKSGAEGISMNEAINRAIQDYVAKGGENIVPEKNRRMLLLVPQSLYDKLSALAKTQGMSVNTAVGHAMDSYVSGKTTDNVTNRLITYIGLSGTLFTQMQSVVSAVNSGCGGIKHVLSQLADTVGKKLPASKEQERRKQIQADIDILNRAVDDMADRVNDIWERSND